MLSCRPPVSGASVSARHLLPLLTMLTLMLLGTGMALADPLRGSGAGPLPSESGGWLPGFLEPLMGWLQAVQRQLMRGLRADLGTAAGGVAPMPALGIIGGAFLYGVLHAAGPGHGKIVVGSYIVGRRVGLRQALALSGVSALVQAIAAILLVGGFALLLDLGGRRLMAQAALLETVSFALIVVLGIGMLRRAIRNEGCGHDHAAPVADHAACCGHSHAHDHHHHGHAPDHDHAHHHEHAHPPAESIASTSPAGRGGWRELLTAALAVGIRPCSGAILVLLFTFANGLILLGIAATLAMAAGTALTVAGVGLGAFGLRHILDRWGDRGRRAERIRQVVGLVCAVLVILFGSALFLASLSGGGAGL